MKRNISISLAFGMLSAFFTCIASEENGKGTSNQDISTDSHAMDIPYTVEEINSDHYILRKKDSDMKIDIGVSQEKPFLINYKSFIVLICPDGKGFYGYIVQEKSQSLSLVPFSNQIFFFLLDEGRTVVRSLLKTDFNPDDVVLIYFKYSENRVAENNNQLTVHCLYCLPDTNTDDLLDIYWEVIFVIEKLGDTFVLKPVKYEINPQRSDVQ